MKIALVSDTTATLDQAVIEKYAIHTVPLTITIDGKSYREQEDLTNKEFYQLLKESDALPTSSQPSPGEWLSLYERLAKTHDVIIVLTLSEKISGTYQTAHAMAQEVKDVDIHVIDSNYSSRPQAYLVEEAGRMIAQDQPITAILAKIEQMIDAMDAYIIVDDLNHLARGGRMSSATALVGSMLKIKPVIRFVDKSLVMFEKIRTQKKAIARVEELFAEVYKNDKQLRATVLHSDVETKAEAIYNEMIVKYPEVEWDVSEFGPVLGTHLGPGALAIVWTIK